MSPSTRCPAWAVPLTPSTFTALFTICQLLLKVPLKSVPFSPLPSLLISFLPCFLYYYNGFTLILSPCGPHSDFSVMQISSCWFSYMEIADTCHIKPYTRHLFWSLPSYYLHLHLAPPPTSALNYCNLALNYCRLALNYCMFKWSIRICAVATPRCSSLIAGTRSFISLQPNTCIVHST